MIYPGTENAFSVGQGNGGGDAKKRLIALMSKKSGALPLFGGHGRGANDLPNVGAPAIGFNPFLKMLAGRPGENFGQQGNQAVQNGPEAPQGGGFANDPMLLGNNPSQALESADPNNQGYQGSSIPTQSAAQADAGQYTGGHYNDEYPGSTGTTGGNPSTNWGTSGNPTGLGQLGQLDPATALFILHMRGGLGGYNQDR